MQAAQPQLQVFVWGAQSHVADNKQFYSSFTLNGTQYSLGDTVCLHPETETQPCYVGRVKACFCDLNPDAPEPHCIEIRWFERLTNLESRHRGQPDKEKELVELEETDINPIGCISCKCMVFRTKNYDEAVKLAKGCDVAWFFSRGLYRQDTNTLVPYADLATGAPNGHDAKRNNRRASASPAAPEEDVADSEDMRSSKKIRMDSTRLNNGMDGCDVLPGDADVERTTGRRKANNNSSFLNSTQAVTLNAAASAPSGRSCVECGATQTPQWREGPHGPKTLCNACGVRYGRQQNRAGKRCGGAGVSRAAAQHVNVGARAPAPVLSSAAQQAYSMPMLPQTHKTASSAAIAAIAAAVSPSSQQGVRIPRERAIDMGGCSQPSSRPVRQAAVLAANRTAEFARTGNFPDMDEARAHAIMAASSAAVTAAANATAQQASCNRARRAAAMQQEEEAAACGYQPGDVLPGPAGLLEVKLEPGVGADRLVSSHESSHNSTESAQDVLLGAVGHMEEEGAPPAYDYGGQQALGQEEEAAILQVGSADFTSAEGDAEEHMLLLDGGADLMLQGPEGLGLADNMAGAEPPAAANQSGSDAVPPQQQQQPHPHHAGKQIGLGGVRHSSSSLAEDGAMQLANVSGVDLRAVAARASLWVPSIGRYSGVLSCIEEARDALPVPMVEGLEALGRAVDKAAAEAAAADAALAAVHQVLLTRQEEAARARGEALDVIGRLRTMMADLVDKHPQLALQGGLQSELGCLPGLEDLDDGLMEGCALLQPCGGGSAHHHMGQHGGHVTEFDVPGDEYDVVLSPNRNRNHVPSHHGDLDDLVNGGRHW